MCVAQSDQAMKGRRTTPLPPVSALTGEQLIALTAAIIETDPDQGAEARALAMALREQTFDAPPRRRKH